MSSQTLLQAHHRCIAAGVHIIITQSIEFSSLVLAACPPEKRMHQKEYIATLSLAFGVFLCSGRFYCIFVDFVFLSRIFFLRVA